VLVNNCGYSKPSVGVGTVYRDYQSFIYSPTDTLVSCLRNSIKIYIKVYIKTAVLM